MKENTEIDFNKNFVIAATADKLTVKQLEPPKPCKQRTEIDMKPTEIIITLILGQTNIETDAHLRSLKLDAIKRLPRKLKKQLKAKMMIIA